MSYLSRMTPLQFKQWRSSKAFNQKEASAFLDVSIHTVQSWEQGRNPIPTAIEKLILNETELKLPLDLISSINEAAQELGMTFEQVLMKALREGVNALFSNPPPKLENSEHEEK